MGKFIYSPNEAIKNNVIGTYKTAYAALTHGAQRFVLISTDKAVNPTNIMGASKRLCEMVIQNMDAVSKSGRWDLLPFVHAHKDKVISGQATNSPAANGQAADGQTVNLASCVIAGKTAESVSGQGPAVNKTVETASDPAARAITKTAAQEAAAALTQGETRNQKNAQKHGTKDEKLKIVYFVKRKSLKSEEKFPVFGKGNPYFRKEIFRLF